MLFGFKKSKKDYEIIFKNPKAVYQLLFSDRTKTSKILGDEEFINAWLSSEIQQEVYLLIRQEAIDGDVPSLKQMVWYLDMMYQNILSIQMDDRQKFRDIVSVLGDRLFFCNQLTAKGIPQHYYAMITLHNLHKAVMQFNQPGTLELARDNLNKMIEHAHAVIKMGKNHPAFDGDAGFIDDAEMIIREEKELRGFLNAMGDSLSKLDGKR